LSGWEGRLQKDTREKAALFYCEEIAISFGACSAGYFEESEEEYAGEDELRTE
jgi:hypothetical protein